MSTSLTVQTGSSTTTGGAPPILAANGHTPSSSSSSSSSPQSLPLSIPSLQTCTPSTPAHDQPTIGLIGMGAMGKMYANALGAKGWKKIHVCDLPEKYEKLKEEYKHSPNVVVMPDGHAVSRSSDFIVYSVEAEFIERVVKQFGPSTKMHAIVAGQTSVKAPEKLAFEKYLPTDVHIVSCHSLHGPSVSPVGQPLIIIKHRASSDAVTVVENILRPLGSRFVYLTYEEHDLVTANTQAVTHAAFLSMGTAWSSTRSYPWEQGLYVGGIETAKVNLTLRIYSNAWHVYAGLAILNPAAKTQIERYATSATELFKMMLEGGNGGETERNRFRERVAWAKEVVFGARKNGGAGRRRPILLSEDLLDKFSLSASSPVTPTASLAPPLAAGGSSTDAPSPHVAPPRKHRPNSHLSLLAMVDCWAHLGINPYDHLTLAATPLFRLFLGVAEYIFLSPGPSSSSSSSSSPQTPQTPLSASLHSALHDTWHRSDDLEFVCAARGWSQAVSFGSFEVYRRRFEETRAFFEVTGRFGEVGRVGGEMIKAVMDSEIGEGGGGGK